MNKITLKRRFCGVLAILCCVSMLQWQPVQRTHALGRAGVSVSRRTGTTAELTMKKMSGVTGYQVFLSTKKKGKYSQIGATRTTSFKMSKLKKNKDLKVYFKKCKNSY